jgi:hypothetical protein
MKYMLLLLFSLTALAQDRSHAEAVMVLHLDAPPVVAFPLFGPIRESEWSLHWNPRILYPADKHEQAGCVFTTGDAIWLVTVYDPAALRVSYVIATPGESAAQLDIVLRASPGGATEATVTHRATSLSDAHDRDVVESIRAFPLQQAHWEHAINARLKELLQ